MDKSNLLVKKTIIIVITIAILFTSGFVLGALSAEIKELAPVAEQVTETTATTAPSTKAPTTQAPTTAAPTTTEAPTETTTTEPSTEAPTETTTEAATEETTEEPCFLIKIALTVLEFCKTIIDAIISLLSSL